MTDPVEDLASALLDLGEAVAPTLAKPRTAAATLTLWMEDDGQRNVALGVILAHLHPEWGQALYRAWLAEESAGDAFQVSVAALERRTLDFMVNGFPIEMGQ